MVPFSGRPEPDCCFVKFLFLLSGALEPAARLGGRRLTDDKLRPRRATGTTGHTESLTHRDILNHINPHPHPTPYKVNNRIYTSPLPFLSVVWLYEIFYRKGGQFTRSNLSSHHLIINQLKTTLTYTMTI